MNDVSTPPASNEAQPPLALGQVLLEGRLPLESVYALIDSSSPTEAQRASSILLLAPPTGLDTAGEPPFQTTSVDARRRWLRMAAGLLYADRLWTAFEALDLGSQGMPADEFENVSWVIADATGGLRNSRSGYLVDRADDRVRLIRARLDQLLLGVEHLDRYVGLDAVLGTARELAVANERNPEHHQRTRALVQQAPEFAAWRLAEEEECLVLLQAGGRVRGALVPPPISSDLA